MNIKSKVINLFGSPGSGKTAGAWFLGSKMKMLGINCEVVEEYCKSLVYSNRKTCLNSQIMLLGNQIYGIEKLVGVIDYIIVDSPILLSAIYAPKDYPNSFIPFLLDFNKRFENVNFLIKRGSAYNPVGRYQTELESNIMAGRIEDFLVAIGEPFTCYTGNEKGFNQILEKII